MSYQPLGTLLAVLVPCFLATIHVTPLIWNVIVCYVLRLFLEREKGEMRDWIVLLFH
jgi:hypothetical protein